MTSDPNKPTAADGSHDPQGRPASDTHPHEGGRHDAPTHVPSDRKAHDAPEAYAEGVPESLPTDAEDPAVAEWERGKSPWQLVMRRFIRTPQAIVGSVMLLLIVGTILINLSWAAENFNKQNLGGVPVSETADPVDPEVGEPAPVDAAATQPAEPEPAEPEPPADDDPFASLMGDLGIDEEEVKEEAEQIEASGSMLTVTTQRVESLQNRPPSDPFWEGRFWLGTDQLGQDVFARIVFGGMYSLAIGIMAAFLAVVIGTAWGVIAGYFGGPLDSFMMRAVDVLYGLPYLLLAAILVAITPPQWGAARVFLAIGLVSWLTMARVVRGEVLSLRNRPFIEAAQAAGIPTYRILFKHMLPNLVATIVVYASLLVPQAILQESFLSFLGLGVSPDTPTWGRLAAEATRSLAPETWHAWWNYAPVFIALAVTLLCLNFIGDGLREAFDPKTKE